jgi:hypothetical protein
MPLFLDIYCIYRYSMEVDEEQIYIQYFAWGCQLYWCDCIIGFKSVEELYPFPPLGVDSADTSQLSKEKNLQGKLQFFQITQPCSSVRYTSVWGG